MSSWNEHQSVPSSPKRACKKQRRIKLVKIHHMEAYSIPREQYEKTLSLLQSDRNHYDCTPQASRAKVNLDDFNQTRYISKNCSRIKCEKRIRTREGYVPEDTRMDLFQLNSPTRIFSAMYECLQSEDWKTMCQLVVASIRSTKAPIMKYRVMLTQLAQMAILHDPLAQHELAEVFMHGVLNCGSVEEKNEFFHSLCLHRNKTVARNAWDGSEAANSDRSATLSNDEWEDFDEE